MVGVFFPANGKFYAMGGRSPTQPGSEFTHPFEYDPGYQQLDYQVSHLPRHPYEQHGLRRAQLTLERLTSIAWAVRKLRLPDH